MKVISKNVKGIVIDDFFENPDFEREKALNSVFSKPLNNFRQVRYSYSQISDSDLLRQFENILSTIGSHFRTELVDSYYGAYYRQDEIESKLNQSWIHFDKFRWIGIAYLNPTDQCQGGTAFYRHTKYGLESFYDFKALKDSSPPIAESVMEDSGNVEMWEVTEFFEMKFNRLVLIDPRYFHQATCFFGDKLNNCRLTQNFIIKPE